MTEKLKQENNLNSSTKNESTSSKPENGSEDTVKNSNEQNQEASNETITTEPPTTISKADNKPESEVVEETIITKEKQEEVVVEIKEEKSTDDKKKVETIEEDTDLNQPEEEEKVDYTVLSKEELVAALKRLIDTKPVNKIRNDTEVIKTNFYKKHHLEIEDKKNKFVEAGGAPEDFVLGNDNTEDNLKGYLQKYKELKSNQAKELENQKEVNYQLKLEVIEEIKNLVHKEESVNKTFQEFRDLQNKWREIGIIPQNKMKDLLETYHMHVDNFYNYIKINKELRDLDLKKNLESKIELCEKAEELILETNIVKAFEELQDHHNQWREIGPVPNEKKDEIWERFKESTSKINKKYQDYFQQKKEEREKNLQAKEVLCEQVESANELTYKSHSEWDEKTKEVLKLQKVWKTLGEVPKKDNADIYKRFRAANDTFFERKKVFYDGLKGEQDDNLQQKIDICVQAESIQDSSEWKKSTEDFIKLQEKWKKIGPVQKKKSDEVWKRFRTACDHFFNKKSEFFKSRIEEEAENLIKKQTIIKSIESYKSEGNSDQDLAALKQFQKDWMGIGFVPAKERHSLQESYKSAINSQFDNINLDESKIELYKYKAYLESLSEDARAKTKLYDEREKVSKSINKLENEIVLLENNMGFFKNSKNASGILDEMNSKVENGRKKLVLLKSKADLVNKAMKSIKN